MRNLSRLWATSLCGVLLFTGVAAPRPVVEHHQFSGKQLFEGIFFGRGIAAASLSEIWGSARSSASTASRMNGLESRITRQYRDFFDQFRRDVTSGDPGLVSDAINDGENIISKARVNEATHESGVTSRARAYADEKDAIQTSTAVSLVVTSGYGVAVVISDNDFIEIVALTQCTVTQCPNVRATAFTRDAFTRLVAQRFAQS